MTTCVWLNRPVWPFKMQYRSSHWCTLTGGVIRAACVSGSSCSDYTAVQLTSRQILSPVVSVIPVVVISAPSQVGLCSNVTVSVSLSSGSGGRSWTSMSWSVAANINVDDSSTQIQTFLTRYGTNIEQSMHIPVTYLRVAKYSITLTVTNFFGHSGTSTTLIDVIDNLNLPTLSIVGGLAKSLTAKTPLSVYSVASFSSCAPATQLLHVWSLFWTMSYRASCRLAWLDQTIYALPAYSLVAGNIYQLVLEVTATGSGSVSAAVSTATTTITVLHGVVTAVMSGGNKRLVPVDKALSLDASRSTDDDFSSSSITSPLSFSWSCRLATLSVHGQSCGSLLQESSSMSSTLLIPTNTMNQSFAYTFTVLVTAVDGRSSSAEVTVQLLPAGSTYTSIKSTVVKFNVDAQLVLNSYVQASFDVASGGVRCSDSDDEQFSAFNVFS